jgi:hypothetical protein
LVSFIDLKQSLILVENLVAPDELFDDCAASFLILESHSKEHLDSLYLGYKALVLIKFLSTNEAPKPLLNLQSRTLSQLFLYSGLLNKDPSLLLNQTYLSKLHSIISLCK